MHSRGWPDAQGVCASCEPTAGTRLAVSSMTALSTAVLRYQVLLKILIISPKLTNPGFVISRQSACLIKHTAVFLHSMLAPQLMAYLDPLQHDSPMRTTTCTASRTGLPFISRPDTVASLSTRQLQHSCSAQATVPSTCTVFSVL